MQAQEPREQAGEARAAPTTSLATLTMALRSGALPLDRYLVALHAWFDEREPAVHAFLPEADRFTRLEREAAHLLERYPDPAARPPLFGVPVGVKDIFHVSGMATRAGSQLPPALFAAPEAAVVTALKTSGALVMGKTVTTEFAYFAPGPTTNPHNPAHTPGGSSSGSAAAVAAELCPLALGTQTIGSLIRPAAFCGVVGYKPSYERLARDGVIPVAPSLDHVGLFTRDVAGMALVAALLAARWQPVASLPRPVLGVPEGPYLAKAAPAGLRHLDHVCARLEEAGFIVKRVAALPDFEAIAARHLDLMAAEAAQTHATWFERYAARYDPRTAALIARGREVREDAVAAARSGRVAARAALMALMDEHQLDLWLAPPAPGAAPEGLDSTGDPVMNLPWTYAGLPVVSIPTGANAAGLPLGTQLAGRWYADENLLWWAEMIAGVLPGPASTG